MLREELRIARLSEKLAKDKLLEVRRDGQMYPVSICQLKANLLCFDGFYHPDTIKLGWQLLKQF